MLSPAMFDKFGKTFEAGDIIFCEFEPGDSFYFIQEGRIKVTKIIAEREKTLDIFEPGDIFGEMAILENAPRSATCIAVEPLKVLEFNKNNFEVLLKSQPELAYKILKIFCKRIFDAKRQLSILVLDKSEVKIADVFLWLTEKMGIDDDESNAEITVEATLDDVTGLSGCSTDECKKVLDGFKKGGVIDMAGNQFIIKRKKELKRIVTAQKKMIERRQER